MKSFDKIDLNPRAIPVWCYWAITGVLTLASLAVGMDAWHQISARAELAEQARQRAFQAVLKSKKIFSQREQEAQRLRQLDQLAKPWVPAAYFPWDELMLSLERLHVPGVRLTSLSVNANQGTAKLTLEGSEATQAVDVVRFLDEGRPLDSRRWQMVRVQAKASPPYGIEAELQFSVESANAK